MEVVRLGLSLLANGNQYWQLHGCLAEPAIVLYLMSKCRLPATSTAGPGRITMECWGTAKIILIACIAISVVFICYFPGFCAQKVRNFSKLGVFRDSLACGLCNCLRTSASWPGSLSERLCPGWPTELAETSSEGVSE